MSLSVLDAAREVPDRIGLVVGHVEHSYAELAARTRAAVAWLRVNGLEGSEDARVALVGTNRLETIVLLYALMEIGAPAVLVHPRLTATERASLLEDARPVLVLDEAAQANLSARRPLLETAREPFASEREPIDPRRTFAILYTSGTSGRSKGAMLSRDAFLAAARASETNLGWQTGDRWLLCMPLAHVGGLSIVVRTLLARRCVVCPAAQGSSGSRFEPEAMAETIARDRVTLVSLVPTMLKKLLDQGWTRPPHLRAILLGGAAAPASLLDDAAARGLPVLTTYGLTEACSQVTTQRNGTAPAAEHGAGEPIPGVEIRIVKGEIHVRGPTLMTGYFPARDPVSSWDPDGWFRTGDLGRIDGAGRLHILARRQDLIVTGGENVYPREVESALERMPGIREACVFGVPDETWGALVAAALVSVGPPPDDDALFLHFNRHLASHKRPRRIAWLPELPRGAQDKLDRVRASAMAGPLLRSLGKE